MGTSGAYGGSPGWNDTRTDTNDWLDANSGSGDGQGSGDGHGDGPPDDVLLSPGDQAPSPPSGDRIDPRVTQILAGVTGRLVAAMGDTSSTPGGGRARRGTGAGSGGGGGGGRGRAAVSGGIAVAGVYGLRSGDAAVVGDAGLSLVELAGLGPFQQAQRIVDAASGPSALIEQHEIREVNANFIWWAIKQDEPPPPAELVKAWVTEFVFRTWLTEAGSVLRDGTRDGAATHALEREVRVTLEAAASYVNLPTDGVRAVDFQKAIGHLLGMLARIFTKGSA
jgi:hypothetical protein